MELLVSYTNTDSFFFEILTRIFSKKLETRNTLKSISFKLIKSIIVYILSLNLVDHIVDSLI